MQLTENYKNVRDYSLELIKNLETEDFVSQPVEFVSPPKWNLAHTTWFFEEFVLKEFVENYKEFDPGYSYLFNSYYESSGRRTERGNRGNMTRPTVDEILEYREHVDKAMDCFLFVEERQEALERVVLGINHEQQHQELMLTDIKYILGIQPGFPALDMEVLCEKGTTSERDFARIEEGIYDIGYRNNGFSYDNERKHHRVYLEGYEIRKDLVSNREYFEFIEDGGYENPGLWHSEAWAWINSNNITAPMYWYKKHSKWFQYSLAGLREIKNDHPVTHVSFYEAWAFARWKSCRLPTEFEWEAAAEHFKWGDRWEWTESAYLPYPGFEIAEGAVGEYNGKFMVNQKVLRGSSCATSPGHSRKTYRNFFHPQLGWQFTGIRLAK